MPGRLVLAILAAYCRLNALAQRWLAAGERFAGAIAVETTTIEQKSAYTVDRYDSTDHCRGSELFDWERRWFDARLPPSPARILLGAAGAGRELLWLLDAGYTVAAFEPAPSMVALAERRLRGRAHVDTFRFEDLIDAVLRNASGPARSIADASYDAVILGWESLSHVVDRELQADLFQALDRICPHGPVLVSFWQRSRQHPVGIGKAERIGRSIGRSLMRLRGSRAAMTDQVVFTTHAGFAYVFTEEEPAVLAERVGRMIASEDNDEFPHVTFLKPGSRTNSVAGSASAWQRGRVDCCNVRGDQRSDSSPLTRA